MDKERWIGGLKGDLDGDQMKLKEINWTGRPLHLSPGQTS